MRLLVLGVVSYLTGAIVVLVQLRSYEIAPLIAFGACVAVGGLIVVRRPGNLIGLTLLGYGSIWSLLSAGIVTAEALDQAGRVDAAAWVTLAVAVSSVPTIWLIAAVWLLFPDGRASTPLDRKLLRWSGVAAAALTIASIFGTPQALPESKAYSHPFVDDSVAQTILDILGVGSLGLFIFGYVVAVRLVIRKRHGDPIERRQAGWIAVAVALNITILLGNVSIAPLGTEDRAFFLIDAVAIVLIPLAVGVAIFRYRLYEIDRILSRSVTYSALVVFIGGVYVAIVVGLGQLFDGDAGFGLSIVATVVVAIAFQPVRRTVSKWANRLVYGERATPHEILVRFSHRSSELSDEDLMERVPQLIVDGTGAKVASLWIASGHGFRSVSSWPSEAAPRHLDSSAHFVDPEADRSLPVLHDGDLLGGLSLVKEQGESVTPAEDALLADLASGLGLALRNTRLTEQLRRQVAELEASRERVLVAADAARRELENTLDSGPQQQLVALKVKLGPTRKRAEQLGATKTAVLLTQLEQQAGDAIKAVRDFAGGIYPPLLEAEGLAVAIGQQARASAIPVSVTADGVSRCSREVEAAVYFSVLEALQNTAKYAEATSITVALGAGNGSLTFDVSDDGKGFDSGIVARGAGLNGIADRLDTVGGTVRIESSPGLGTRIAGTVPTRQVAKV
jgi:signal transduction histidine kinase